MGYMGILDSIISTLVYLGASFILFFLGKLAYQLFHRKINVKDELVEKDNLAFAVAHTGYFIGLLLAIGSALIGPTQGLALDLLDMLVYGLLAIVLLNVSIIMRKIKKIRNRSGN